jgi:hypothetical protein
VSYWSHVLYLYIHCFKLSFLVNFISVASPRSGSPDDFKVHDEDGDDEMESLTKIGKDGMSILLLIYGKLFRVLLDIL